MLLGIASGNRKMLFLQGCFLAALAVIILLPGDGPAIPFALVAALCVLICGWCEARGQFSELLRVVAEARLGAIDRIRNPAGAVSHRLRTQLHAIIGHAELIVADAETQETRDSAQLIANSAERLFRLLQDHSPQHRHADPLRCLSRASVASLLDALEGTHGPFASHYGVSLLIARSESDDQYPPVDMSHVQAEVSRTLAGLLKARAVCAVTISAAVHQNELNVCMICSPRRAWLWTRRLLAISRAPGQHHSVRYFTKDGQAWVIQSFGWLSGSPTPASY